MRIHDHQGSFEVLPAEPEGFRWRLLDARCTPLAWSDSQATERSAIAEARAELERRRRAALVKAIAAYFGERMSHASLQLTLDRLQIRGTVDGQGIVTEDYARRPSQWLAFDHNGQVVERKEWPAARKVRLRQAGQR